LSAKFIINEEVVVVMGILRLDSQGREMFMVIPKRNAATAMPNSDDRVISLR
jgi:hypothetical protein